MANITLPEVFNLLPNKELSSLKNQIWDLQKEALGIYYKLSLPISEQAVELLEEDYTDAQVLYVSIDLKHGKTYPRLIPAIELAKDVEKYTGVKGFCELLRECPYHQMKFVCEAIYECGAEGREFIFLQAFEVFTENGERLLTFGTEDYSALLEEMKICFKEAENRFAAKKRAPRKTLELDFESRIEAFLQVNEIHVERQVSTNQKRVDLWIPDQLMIEVKSGKVTGDDACQAIDYLATFERDVLLVGTGMSSAASRGIEAANKISKEAKILFVTQEACFGYLKSVCK